MKPVKKIIILISLLLLISLLIGGGTFITIFLNKIPYNTEEQGFITDEIKIYRNGKGFPTVEINNRDDLYFAIGYIHAKDQLNQMEYQRGIATGFAHIFDINNADKLNRISALIGFEKKSLSILAEMSREEIDPLLSYCEGVNFIRKNFTGAEKLSRDWAPSDILSILLMREWANSYLNNIELMINVNESPGMDVRKKFRDQKYISYYNYDQLGHLRTIRAVKNLLEKHVGTFNRGYSVYISENLHISPSGDTALFSYQDSLSVYPSWYPLVIKMGSRNIFAVTSTGMPFFFTYRDDNTFFSHFNINADTQDFFIFNTELKENTNLYRSSGTLKEFKILSLTSLPGSNNRPDPLRITDKGPVLSDIFTSISADDTVVALNSILPGKTYISLLLSIPFENNFNTKVSSIRQIEAAPKSFMLISGNRKIRINSGEFTPYPSSPSVFKNGNVYTSTARAKLNTSYSLKNIDKTGSALISTYEIPYQFTSRIINNKHQYERFNEILLPVRVYNDNKIKSILNDTYSAAAEKFVPLFLSMLDANILTSAKLTRIYFNDWNFDTGKDEVPASIFYSIMNCLIEESYKDVFQEDTANNLNYAWLLYEDILIELSLNNTGFFNFNKAGKIRNREAVFDTAFLDSMRFLNRKMGPLMDEWKWGELTKGQFAINNPHLSYLSYIFSYNDKSFSGAPDTIAATFPDMDFNSVYTESLKGYLNNNTMRLSTNYSYSTNISSEFYYGRADSITMMNIGKRGNSFKTVIKPIE
jgi:penicillin amidase